MLITNPSGLLFKESLHCQGHSYKRCKHCHTERRLGLFKSLEKGLYKAQICNKCHDMYQEIWGGYDLSITYILRKLLQSIKNKDKVKLNITEIPQDLALLEIKKIILNQQITTHEKTTNKGH